MLILKKNYFQIYMDANLHVVVIVPQVHALRLRIVLETFSIKLTIVVVIHVSDDGLIRILNLKLPVHVIQMKHTCIFINFLLT